MDSSGLTRQIIQDLALIPAERLSIVADFVHGRAQETVPNVDRLRHLERFSGVISDEEAQLMLSAIEAECERIDPDADRTARSGALRLS